MHLKSFNKETDGYKVLFNFFKKLEITQFFGVTGGGVVHFLKHIAPYSNSDEANLFSIGEYTAGFAPLGYYLTNKKIAASVSTLGAATKLIMCGLSDAKLHDIPSIYIVPAYDTTLDGQASLQDSSIFGSNVIEQLYAECPDSVFVFNRENDIYEQLARAELALKEHKPVVFVLNHSALTQPTSYERKTHSPTAITTSSNGNAQYEFLAELFDATQGKKLTVLVGEEMNLYPDSKNLLSQLSEKLKPYIIWSMNGANSVSANNKYGYGYLGFGGNDLANNHFNQLGAEDVLLVLGACPDEYTVNLQNFSADHTFYCTNIKNAYGQVQGSLQHRAQGKYSQLNYPLDSFIHDLLADQSNLENIPAPVAPENLNTRIISASDQGFTHMEHFYQRLNTWWPKNSIAFSDVCLAYKDRQYVTQRPNDNIDFYSLYRGSAMGYVLGAAIGAKIATPDKNVFAFTGDGCFKLFAGSLAEAADLGITLFVLNNSKFSIVDQGLHTILPDIPTEYWHSEVKPIDYCKLAEACGWRSNKLNVDLSNLEDLLDSTLESNQSLLIEVTVDPNQILGINPRVHNL